MRFISKKGRPAPDSPENSTTSSSVSSATTSPTLVPVPSGDGALPPAYEFSIGKNPAKTAAPPPISRQSSSSVLRTMAGSGGAEKKAPEAKKKNTPYRPAPELQAHIDRLDQPSTVTALTTSTSAFHTEYFDVLPSFQMFQSILKRDDDQFSENLVVKPPEYGDTANSSPTPPLSPSLSPVTSGSRSNTIDNVLDGGTEDEDGSEEEEAGNYIFADDENNDGYRQSRAYEMHSSSNIARAQDTYGHTVLDNIDRLQRLNNSPIDIQIHVTKKVPIPHTVNDLETRLKEYSDGDLVNGYVIITNNSDKPVSFGLFTVSLEGTIKASESRGEYDKSKPSKVLVKKFLKMYDFNASYGYSHVPNSAGIEYEAFSKDQSDGCMLGLPNERILEPRTKYKKFFTFKFPNKLLDNACSFGLRSHLIPPPSIGIDRTSFSGRAAAIEVNKALGYGCLAIRGTPLLTRDNSFDNMSVSYAIEAKFIDKLNIRQQDALNADDINTSNERDYVISSSRQYFLRYIPNIQNILKHDSEQDVLFGRETYNTVGVSKKLYHSYKNLVTWKTLNELNYMVEQEIDSRLAKDEFTAEDIKHKNMITDNQAVTMQRFHSFQIHEKAAAKQEGPDLYADKCMVGSRKAVGIKGKKKKKFISSVVDIGAAKIFVQIPDKPLPYSSPKLLTKYNVDEDYEEPNDLVPINSIASDHINDLYQRDDNNTMHKLTGVLEFVGQEPPSISAVDVQIVAWTFRSDYPLAFKLDYDFFYNSPHVSDAENDSEYIKVNLQVLKDQMANYIGFLKENKVSISKDSFLYLKSMKTLGVKRDTIKEFFRVQTASNNPELFANNWSKDADGVWRKHMNIPLEITNKNNINLIPSFQSCLIGRGYCLQVCVKLKGDESNVVRVEVPILVG